MGALSSILDMVKVMQFAVSEGKVAVHCHAGLGMYGMEETVLLFLIPSPLERRNLAYNSG